MEQGLRKVNLFIFEVMILDRYQLISGDSLMVFEFTSEGSNGKISKIVQYSKTNLEGFYNLGFGDKDLETGEISDQSISNNGDSQKVLATVATTVPASTSTWVLV